MDNPESRPKTAAEIGHLRWLLQYANTRVDEITHPATPAVIVIDALFLAFFAWVSAMWSVADFLPGRILLALCITVVGVSLLGGLYHYLIARPLARRRRTAV